VIDESTLIVDTSSLLLNYFKRGRGEITASDRGQRSSAASLLGVPVPLQIESPGAGRRLDRHDEANHGIFTRYATAARDHDVPRRERSALRKTPALAP